MIQIATECTKINNWGKHTHNYIYKHNIRTKFTITGTYIHAADILYFEDKQKGSQT